MTAFEKLSSHTIPALRATVEEYVEPSSGARHVHLTTDGADLAFLVAFPTVPDSSDGRAHILEHLALSGSRRYPVRNPFFSMLRRSTASFMNAMTYADRTVYPFASADRNDFFNLLDVYLDATFFPTLDYLNFRQEGWRYTLDDGKLGYQGVVFNEMKGAFTDPVRALYNGIGAQLLAGTTYAVVSGGDPLAIPDLSHQALKDFHATHYHPSQALFMSAGPIGAADIQSRIAERVLAERAGAAARFMPQDARVDAPRRATIAVPSQAGGGDAHGVQIAWILGESADPDTYYRADLLQAGLLGDASAPVRRAMESAGYGRPSRLNGMDSSARQLLFHVGMEGLRADQQDPARTLLWTALERAAEDGVPAATLQAALRDITYGQRDTAGGRMPNVLARMLAAVPVAMRGGDVMGAFDSSAALARLREDVADPGFFKRAVRALLDNTARLDAEVAPDADYFTRRAALEEARLAAAQATLGDDDRARIQADSAGLAAMQDMPTDTSVLPRIRPGDVTSAARTLPAVAARADGHYAFDIASNGISYARIQYDVGALDAGDWPWLQLHADLIDELGVAGMDFEAAGAWRRSRVARFGAGVDATLATDGALRLDLVYYASGLREEHAHIAEVLTAHADAPRFDEHARIRFLVERMARRRLERLAQDGDRYAFLDATAPLSALRDFEAVTGGMAATAFLAGLQRQVATDAGVADVAARLARLHARVSTCPRTVLAAGSGSDAAALVALFGANPAPAADATTSAAHPAAAAGAPFANDALHAPSQVNHCHIAWRAPGVLHPDAPALAVAAELMTHQVLHQALRERGGAYGGHATYAANAGTFSMSSYRDPRLAATYADFGAAVERLLAGGFTDEQMEEAIVSVVKKLDHPSAPYDTVLGAWHLARRGVDQAARQRYRTGVLACTEDAVRAAAGRWLRDAPASRAASVGNVEQDLAGLRPVELQAVVQAR